MVNIIVKTDSILSTLNRDRTYFKEHGIKTELINSHILYVGGNDDVRIIYVSSENNILGRRADYWIGFDYDEVRYRLRSTDLWIMPDRPYDERHIAAVTVAFSPTYISKSSIIRFAEHRAEHERNVKNGYYMYKSMMDDMLNNSLAKIQLNSFYGLSKTSTSDEEKENMRVIKPTIKDVKFNGPATIVFWSDDTKTVVKCEGEKFDKEKGLAMAIAKKFMGTNETKSNYYDIFDKYCSDPEEPVTSIADAVSNLASIFGKILSSEKKCSNCKHLYRHDPGMPCESCVMHSRWEEN